MVYTAGSTVNEFYMDANIPISAKVNIYKGSKKVLSNYEDTKETAYDNDKVKAYSYNRKTNLLKIYC